MDSRCPCDNEQLAISPKGILRKNCAGKNCPLYIANYSLQRGHLES